MKTTHLAAALLIAASLQAPLVGPVCAQVRRASPAPASPQQRLDELLAADRAFAEIAARTSFGNALAAMLDEDVILPLPNATFARGRTDALNGLSATDRKSVV